MSIGEGIKQLLEERKRVILPGFGNLEVKESGGSMPAPGKRIDPPGPNIKFDNSFSKDDGVLATAFAEEEGIEKAEAEQQVLELVDAIRFALDKGESYPLAGAGMFRRDEEGKIHFQVDLTWVLEPDQYGLDSMDLLELEDLPLDEKEPIVGDPEADKAPAPDVVPVPDVVPESDLAAEPDAASASDSTPAPDSQAEPESRPEPVAEKASEKIIEPESVPPETPPAKPVMRLSAKPESKPVVKAHEPWKDKKTTKRSGLWRSIWIVTGILLVILVALIVVPVEKWERAGKKDQPREAVQAGQPVETPVASDQSAAGEDNAGETVDSEPAQEAVAETGTETEPEAQPLPVQSDDFFIIAGSFSHLANASELQDKLKAQGYPAEVMVTENRMYRVSVASYATNREAEAGLVRIQSEPGMESCWLLSNE